MHHQLGPELQGYYLLFLYPYPHEPTHFQVRLSPDRSVQPPASLQAPEFDVRSYEALEACLVRLGVNAISRQLQGSNEFVAVACTPSGVLDLARHEEFHRSQGLTLLCLETSPTTMSQRVLALQATPGIRVVSRGAA